MSKFYEKVIRPALFHLDAERAHELGLKAMQLGLARAPAFSAVEEARLTKIFGPIHRFGLRFRNPLGAAAGFDKNGKVVHQLAELGFGFVEVGTVTFEPQDGNSKPRLFRLPDDKALINRLGFNNDGALAIAARLSNLRRNCTVGVNIGRNKDISNDRAVENYLRCFNIVHPVADYIVVNVSSPNTPNLRDLQSSENLELLIDALQFRNNELGTKPLLVKIGPDLKTEAIDSIVELCLRSNVDGIVATNTTVSRDGLQTHEVEKLGSGGLSGRPLAPRSTQVISQIFRSSKGRLPIVGVGGIFTAEDAFEKISAGAVLIQAYTGFVYTGPSFAHQVISRLADLISERGFKSLDDVVGAAVK